MAQQKPKVEFLREIQKRAMLAKIKVRTWSPNKVDRAISDEVAARHGANRKAGRYVKRCLDSPELKAVQKSAIAIRKMHWNLTSRFGDSPGRLLPVENYKGYRTKIDGVIAKYINAREAFLAVYLQQVQEARSNLGTMFNPGDYPEVDTLRNKIAADYTVDAITTSDSFVGNTSIEFAMEIQQKINDETFSKVKDSCLFLLERIETTTRAIAEKLEYKKADVPKIFRDSLLSNARQAAKAARDLNVAGVKEITDLADKVEQLLDGVEANMLRPKHKDFKPETREVVRKTAAQIRKEAGEMLAGFGA